MITIIKLNMVRINGFFLIMLLFLVISPISILGASPPGTSDFMEHPVEVPAAMVPGGSSAVELSNSITMSQCQGMFAGGFNPQDNLMSSIMGLCLPGILVNLHRLEQNTCEKILCEYNAARQGLSPIACAKQSAYNTCLITGQGFDVVEGILIGALRQNIRQILEDPLAFGISRVQDILVRQTATCTGGVCTTPASKTAAIALAVLEIPNVIQTVRSLISQFQSLGQSQESACERLEDIREELEQLIAQHEAAQRR